MLQNRGASATRYLDKAKPLIELLDNPIDSLNFYYYAAVFELKFGTLKAAEQLVKQWESASKGIAKFENLAQWFSGKVLLKKGKLRAAEEKMKNVLADSERQRLPYLAFQVLQDLAALAKLQEDSSRFEEYSTKMQIVFQEFLNRVGDEILRRQIEESG